MCEDYAKAKTTISLLLDDEMRIHSGCDAEREDLYLQVFSILSGYKAALKELKDLKFKVLENRNNEEHPFRDYTKG